MNEIFINLSQKDQELINKFMENLNKKISLTRKETKEFQNDFVKMINFYLSKGKKIDVARSFRCAKTPGLFVVEYRYPNPE